MTRRTLPRRHAAGAAAAAAAGLGVAGRLGWLRLRGTGLLLALGLLTLVVVAGLVRGRGLAGRGPVRFAARAGLVLTCQLLAVSLLAVVINDWFDFYSSWDDLLGTGRPVVLTLQPPRLPRSGPAGGVAGVAGQPAGPVPAGPVDRRYAAPEPRGARLEPLLVTGARTGLSSHALVLLPPQYGDPAYAGRRFPVTLVLAGYPGHLGSLEGSLAVPQTVDSLIHTGRVAPMVWVLASPTLVPPRDTECTDVPGGPQVQTFLARDLPQVVAAHYRVTGTTGWGVLGFSTGGFCAAKLALTHPDVFRAAVSLSGYQSAITDLTTGDLFGGSTAVRHANDPLWRVAHLPPPPVSLLLTASKAETGVYDQVEQLAALSRPPLEVSTITPPTGGHNPSVWRQELPLCLQWLSAVLTG